MNIAQQYTQLYAGALPTVVNTQGSRGLVDLYNNFHHRPAMKIIEGLTEAELAFVQHAKDKAYYRAMRQTERNKWPPAKQKQFALQAAKVAEREAVDYMERMRARAEAGVDRKHEGVHEGSRWLRDLKTRHDQYDIDHGIRPDSSKDVGRRAAKYRTDKEMSAKLGRLTRKIAANQHPRLDQAGLGDYDVGDDGKVVRQYTQQRGQKGHPYLFHGADPLTKRQITLGNAAPHLRQHYLKTWLQHDRRHKNEDAVEDFWKHYDKAGQNYDKRYNASHAEMTNHALTKVLDKVGASNTLPPNVRFRAQEGMTIAQQLLEDYRRAGFGLDERSSNWGRSSLVGARELQSFLNVPTDFAKRLHRRSNKPKAPAEAGLISYAARHRQWAKDDPTVKHAPTKDDVRKMVKQNAESFYGGSLNEMSNKSKLSGTGDAGRTIAKRFGRSLSNKRVPHWDKEYLINRGLSASNFDSGYGYRDDSDDDNVSPNAINRARAAKAEYTAEGYVDERGGGSRLRRTKRRIGFLQHDLNKDFYNDVGLTDKDVNDSVQYLKPKEAKKVLRDMRTGLAKKFVPGGDIRQVPTQDKYRIERTNEGMTVAQQLLDDYHRAGFGTDEGWVLPAVAAGTLAVAGAAGLAAVHKGALGKRAQAAVQPITQPAEDKLSQWKDDFDYWKKHGGMDTETRRKGKFGNP